MSPTSEVRLRPGQNDARNAKERLKSVEEKMAVDSIENRRQIEKVCLSEDVSLVKFVYLVFTRMPGESYRRRLRSLLLHLCYVFRALINSLVC